MLNWNLRRRGDPRANVDIDRACLRKLLLGGTRNREVDARARNVLARCRGSLDERAALLVPFAAIAARVHRLRFDAHAAVVLYANDDPLTRDQPGQEYERKAEPSGEAEG